MDNFAEQLVKKNETSGDKTRRVLMVIVGIFFALALAALAVLQLRTPLIALLGFALAVAAGYGTFHIVQNTFVEYEYTFTNNQLDFAQVFNNKKRKNLGTMNIKNLEACGLVSSGSFNRYINMQGIKRTNWFLNRDAELMYFYYQKDGQKRIIIIEPNEEMIALIKRNLPQGVWQNN